MLYLKKCSFINGKGLLEMSCSRNGNTITANVHAPYILGMALHFLHLNKNEKVTFILKVQESANKELDYSKSDCESRERNHYRIPVESFEKATSILFFFSEILSKDGLCFFGFETESGDIFMSEKYNIITITSENIGKYDEIFEAVNMPKKDKIITAYDVMSKNNPGFSKAYTFKGVGVCDIPDLIKAYGII